MAISAKITGYQTSDLSGPAQAREATSRGPKCGRPWYRFATAPPRPPNYEVRRATTSSGRAQQSLRWFPLAPQAIDAPNVARPRSGRLELSAAWRPEQ